MTVTNEPRLLFSNIEKLKSIARMWVRSGVFAGKRIQQMMAENPRFSTCSKRQRR